LITALLQRLAPGRQLQLSDAALQCLQGHPFPGNIRELRNLLERAVLLADGDRLETEHFPLLCDGSAASAEEAPHFSGLLSLDELQQRYLRWALSRYPADKGWLAQQLGVSERTLYRKLERLKQAPPEAP